MPLSRLSSMLLITLAMALPLPADALDEPTLKALYLYNFVQFVTWPQEASGDTTNSNTLRLCIVGGDPGGRIGALNGRPVRRMRIQIQQEDKTAPLGKCHVVYLPAGSDSTLARLIETTHGLPVLVVSEGEAAAPLGAAISVFEGRERKLEFDINLSAARNAGLQISSRLLQLARRVY